MWGPECVRVHQEGCDGGEGIQGGLGHAEAPRGGGKGPLTGVGVCATTVGPPCVPVPHTHGPRLALRHLDHAHAAVQAAEEDPGAPRVNRQVLHTGGSQDGAVVQ
jgi:hypothetical protein